MKALAVVLAMMVLAAPQGAAAIDLHALWHDRCQGCHGHAGAFARERAPLRDGLEAFLAGHRGGLSAGLARGVAAMLHGAAVAPDLFARQCRICHGPAASFVRERLTLRDDRLAGRYSGRDIDAFLRAGHGRLEAGDAEVLAAQLRRVLGEVRYEAD
ncbi:hypothetical protein ACM64Y_15030 [Novispirillum sp. DQ9]|uniref:hypothetical protein n=1 Tax=Novispirillum sp. DQ9 TaxID=3398612 RepID=UPI003C7C535B